MKDAFDQWWEWANKPFSDRATIPAEIHQPIMALPPEDCHDRAKVNEAVRRYQRAQAERRPMEHVQALTSEPAFDTLAAVPTFLTAFFTAPAELLVFFAV